MSGLDNMLVRVEIVSTDDSGGIQTAKVRGLDGEMLGGDKGVVVIQAFGETGVPPVGSHGVAFFPGGNRTLGVLIGRENADLRPRDLAAGEKKVYGAAGQFMHMRADGAVVIHGTKIVLDGIVYTGGEDADKPAAMQGTIDSAGHTDVAGLATKVFVK